MLGGRICHGNKTKKIKIRKNEGARICEDIHYSSQCGHIERDLSQDLQETRESNHTDPWRKIERTTILDSKQKHAWVFKE